MKFRGITIHKNKNCDTWYTRIRKNGKQLYISAKTQKECYNKLKIEINKKNVNENIKTITLQEWYQKWLKLYKIGKVKDTTIEDYEKSIKYISKETINKNINEINVELIITELNKIKGERQRQKVYELLCMLYKKATDNDQVKKNIMVLIDKPKHKKQNGKPLTHQQEKQFIKECEKHKYGDFFLVSLYQGLRKGECLAITRDDIDFENNTLQINKAINSKNNFDTTKNEFSNRTMPLFNKTKKILQKYKETLGRIFKYSYYSIDDYIKELRNKLNFHISSKYMRYTFITRCQEQNIPEFITQAWCGHEIGSEITKEVYTKYNAEDNKQYIDILNESKFYSNSTHMKK